MRLYLFGSVRIQTQEYNRILTGNSAELLGLIAYGNIQNRAVTRSKLAGTLFPNVSEEQARKLLTNAIYRLKRDMGASVECLNIQGDRFELRDVWIDVIEFERLLKTAVSPYVREALSLFTADFLDDIVSEWVLAPRINYREQYLMHIRDTVHTLLDEKNHTQALKFAHHWCQVDPLDENAHLSLMKIYQSLGRTAAAIQQFTVLKNILNDELGIEPTKESLNFFESIKTGRESNDKAHDSSNLLFVGRQSERGAILDKIESGAGDLIVVSGEPGIGKTRLLQEVAQAAQWRGVRVVWGKADEREVKRPFQHIKTAFQDAVRGPWRERILPDMTPLTIKTLLPIVPQLQRDTSQSEQWLENNPYKNNPSLNLAIRQLFVALTNQQPHLVFFDDVQWADRAFWTLLPTLAKLTLERPLTILLSYRSTEMRENQVGWSAMLDLDKEHSLHRYQLEGLSASDSLELANMIGFNPPESEFNLFYSETGGNPLMIREMAENRDLKVGKLYANKLKKLPEPSMFALQAASVLGREFSYSHWMDICQSDFLIEPILEQRLITETESGYAFRHDLLRAHIYQTLNDKHKKQLHGRAVTILQQEKHSAAELGYHAKKAEQWNLAAKFFQKATKYALQMGDYENAREYARVIHQILPLSSLSEAEKLPCALLDMQLKHIEVWSSETEQEAVDIFELAKKYGDLVTLHGITLERIKHTAVQGKFDQFDELAEEAIAIAQELDDIPCEIITLNEIAYKTATFRQQTDKALAIGYRALELAESNGRDPYLTVTSLFTVVYINFKIQEAETAQKYLRQAEVIFEENAQMATLNERLLNLQAFDAQHSGNIELAREINNQLVEINRQSGDQMRLQAALFSSCALARKLGQLDEAILYAEELFNMVAQKSHNKDEYQTYFYRAQLADCLLANRDCAAAEKVLEPIIAWVNEQDQMGHSAMYGSIVIGILYIYQNQYDKAIKMFKWVVDRSESKGSLTYIPLLCLAESYALCGKIDDGIEVFRQAEGLMKFNVPKNDMVYFYLIEYLLLHSPISLSKARDVMIKVAYSYSKHQFRRDFWRCLPINQDVEEQWAALEQGVGKTAVLTKIDAPFGKKLTDLDRIKVKWTPDDPEFDADFLKQEGKVGLRHYRLMRLVLEANCQGAAPTLKDLSKTLGVAERTLERDMTALEEKGISLHTRRHFLQ